MNNQDLLSAEQGSKPSKQVALGDARRGRRPEKREKSEKIFCIDSKIEVLHRRSCYVAARSVAEARRKHEDGLSVEDPDHREELEYELSNAVTETGWSDYDPVEVTDQEELENARELIAEQH